MKNRVVITGMGAVTPIGNDMKFFCDNIKQGTCGIDVIKSFDIKNYKCTLGAEAIENSRLDLNVVDSERLSVIVDSGIGGLSTIEQEHIKLMEKGPSKVSPYYGSCKHCNKIWG